MVCLNAINLFTKVPTDVTLTVVRNTLDIDPALEGRTFLLVDNLREMLAFWVKTTCFGMESDIYEQEEGLAMGTPLSSVLANVYMEGIEEMALGFTLLKLSIWLRYADDTFFSGSIRKMLKH